jgi:probable rRNA maturation factor
MPVEVTVRPHLDPARRRGLPGQLRTRGQKMLRHLGHHGRTLSVLITDDAEMRTLNLLWRKRNRTTDVLSFEGHGEVLGDVVISLDQAERQAERMGVALGEEVTRLLIHGTLHLLGHIHRTAGERRAMNALTEEILKRIR